VCVDDRGDDADERRPVCVEWRHDDDSGVPIATMEVCMRVKAMHRHRDSTDRGVALR
jgi:hypothetical protein